MFIAWPLNKMRSSPSFSFLPTKWTPWDVGPWKHRSGWRQWMEEWGWGLPCPAGFWAILPCSGSYSPGQPQETKCQMWSELLTVSLECKTHDASQAFDKNPDPELLRKQPKWREVKSERTREKKCAETNCCSNASSLNFCGCCCSEPDILFIFVS